MSKQPEGELANSDLISIRRRLNHWFRKHGRQLPWRETRNPYYIWISEIMLQQTTVKAVVPYFERFIKRFPTVSDLASASEEEVLQHWEGLGYYSRGRNIRKAAIVLCENHAGSLPKSLEQLQKLPGIGRYTAGAIRSFAFALPAPIVEANTLRLYCRILNYHGDPRSRDGEKKLWEFAEKLQPKTKAGQLNQALMELGSQVCTPIDPKCESCPLKMHCKAFLHKTQTQVPLKKSRPKVTQIVEATVAIKHQGRYLLRQRESSERWAGMWDFIRFPVEAISYQNKLSDKKRNQIRAEILSHVKDFFHLEIDLPEIVHELKHSVTRYRIRLICCVAELAKDYANSQIPESATIKWACLAELEDLPMPVTGRQLVKELINIQPG